MNIQREDAAFVLHKQGVGLPEIGRRLGRSDDPRRAVSRERARQLVNRAYRQRRCDRIKELKEEGFTGEVARDRACKEIDGLEPFMLILTIPPEKRSEVRDLKPWACKLHCRDVADAQRQTREILRRAFRTPDGTGTRAETLSLASCPEGTTEEAALARIFPDLPDDVG